MAVFFRVKIRTTLIVMAMSFALFSPAQAATTTQKTSPVPKTSAPTESNTFGDWTVVCTPAKNTKTKVCEAAQTQMMDVNGGKKGRLLRLSIARREGNQFLMHALLPLGLHIPAGVAAKVDENAQQSMTLQRCTAIGCEAIWVMDDALMSQLKKSQSLKIGIKVETQTMIIPVSLKGLADAMDKIK